MSFLDLYQGDQDQAAKIQPTEGHDLPSGFDANFHAAWSDGLLFSQSVARENARAGVLNDYVSEIRQKTGQDLSQQLNPDANEGTIGPSMFEQANARVAKMKESYPDLDLNPLSEDDIDSRALAKAQSAHRNYQALEAGEKTFGGSVGSFLGSAAAGVADPINIVALPIAPEAAGIGILSTALRWGALAGVSQAAIEFSSDQFKEQVQPGYTESGAPLHEIGGAFLGGAVVGGTIKALGNAWSRVKTGQWPTSVRDAGNVIESEANIASSNPLPGVEGEVAHREALVKTIDDILAGRPVDVSAQVTPELQQAAADAARAKAIAARPQSTEMPKQQMELPLKGAAIPDNEFTIDAYHGTNDIIEKFDPDQTRLGRGVFFSDNPELANKFAHGLGTDSDAAHFPDEPGFLDWIKPLVSDKEFSSISEIHAKHDIAMAEMDKHEIDSAEYLKAQDEFTKLSRKLNEEAKKVTAYINHDTGGFTQAPNVTPVRLRLGKTHEVDMGGKFDWEVEREAIEHAREKGFDSVTFKNFGEGNQKMYSMLDAKNIRGRFERAAEGPQPVMQTADEMNKTMAGPDHQEIIRGDIDHAIREGDVMVPGIDENGNHAMVSAKDALAEVDRYKQAADEIQACAAPIQEAAE